MFYLVYLGDKAEEALLADTTFGSFTEIICNSSSRKNNSIGSSSVIQKREIKRDSLFVFIFVWRSTRFPLCEHPQTHGTPHAYPVKLPYDKRRKKIYIYTYTLMFLGYSYYKSFEQYGRSGG
jgi:hypothetical protein